MKDDVQKPGKYGLPVKVCVALLLFTQMTQALVNPSLSGIMADLPGSSATTYQTIINIATLVMIVSALATAPLVKKIGFKTAGLIGMACCFIGGITPAFFHPSIAVLIGERAFFGIGYGMVYSLGIAACGEFWRGKDTTNMVGVAIFAAGLAGIVYNLASSMIAPLGWTYIYWVNFIIVPFMIYYAIFMPRFSDLSSEEGAVPAGEASAGEKAAAPAVEKKGFSFAGLGKNFWVFIVCMMVALAAVCAFMNNIAMIVIGTGIDATGAAVGIIMTGFGAGLMVGGALYPFVYRGLKRAALPLFLLIDAACFLIIMFYSSYITLVVCAVVVGIMFGALNASWSDMGNKKVADYPAASASGASVFIAASGLAQFLSPFFLAALAGIAGLSEANPFYQYYPAILIIGVGGIVLLVMAILKKNKVDYEHEDVAA